MELEKHNIFQISVFKGRVGNPESIARTLLEYEKDATQNSEDPNDIRNQDHLIPCDPWLSDEIEEVWNYIEDQVKQLVGRKVVPQCDPWFIHNRKNEQIFPHNHTD